MKFNDVISLKGVFDMVAWGEEAVMHSHACTLPQGCSVRTWLFSSSSPHFTEADPASYTVAALSSRIFISWFNL